MTDVPERIQRQRDPTVITQALPERKAVLMMICGSRVVTAQPGNLASHLQRSSAYGRWRWRLERKRALQPTLPFAKVPACPHHGQVQHRDLNAGGVASNRRTMPVQGIDLGLQQSLFRGQVTSVGLLRHDPQRAALSRAADDDRHFADWPRVAGGFRQMHVSAVVGLGAGRPERSKSFDADLKLIKSFTVVGEVQAVRLVLAQPPAGSEAAEGATVAKRVEGCDGLGNDAWFAERDWGYQRAQPEVGVKAGEQAEREPRFRYRLPRAIHLGNLDQVVHQGNAVEADGIGGKRQIAKPAGRIFGPRKPRDLQHDSRPRARTRIVIESGLLVDLRGRGALLVDDQYLVPGLIVRSLDKPADPAQLIGKDWGRDRPVAPAVALTAQRCRCVHDHQHCREAGLTSKAPVRRSPFRIQPQGVDHRGQ